MLNKEKILPLLLLVLIAVFIPIKYFDIQKRNSEKYFFEIKQKDVSEISIFNGKKDMKLSFENNKAVFNVPFAGIEAWQSAIDKYFKILAKVVIVKEIKNINNADLKKYGINDKSSRIFIKSAKAGHTFLLGSMSPVAPLNYVYSAEKNKLYLINAGAAIIFNVKPEDFRNNKVFDFGIDEIKNIRITSKTKQPVVFEKESGDWYVSSAEGSPEYLCDKQKFAELANRLLSLEITDFEAVDKKISLKDAGLETPVSSVEIVLSSTKTFTLGAGKPLKDSLLVSLNSEILGGVNIEFNKFFQNTAESYVRKSVIDFPIVLISAFETISQDARYRYERRRGRWYRLANRDLEIDENKVLEFVYVLSQLSAEKYYFDDFGEVVKEYAFYSRNKELLARILVGLESYGYVKVMIEGKKTIFGVPTDKIDLLKL